MHAFPNCYRRPAAPAQQTRQAEPGVNSAQANYYPLQFSAGDFNLRLGAPYQIAGDP